MRLGASIGLALDRTTFLAGSSQRGSNGSDFCVHAGGECDAAGSTFGDCGGAERDIESITWSRLGLEDGLWVLTDGK